MTTGTECCGRCLDGREGAIDRRVGVFEKTIDIRQWRLKTEAATKQLMILSQSS